MTRRGFNPFSRVPGQDVAAAVLVAVNVVLVNLLVRAATDAYPFGNRSGGYGDFGPQYMTFYARFREQLTSGDLSSLFFSWELATGAPAVGDYVTYLGGPFTFLVVLFPADRVLMGMWLIIWLKLAVAGVLMYWLLRRLSPGAPRWLGVVLATCYASNSWVMDVGIFTPQWLDGLLGLPALCLVALRCRRAPTPWLPGALTVAVVWWGNYYSAYMASIFAGLFLFTVEAAVARSWRSALASSARFVGVGLSGVWLTFPLFLPTVWAMFNGVGRTAGLPVVPTEWDNIGPRLLPLTQGEADSPNIYASTLVLLLGVAFFVAPHIGVRVKAAFGGLAALMVVSLHLPALLLVWNLFQTPHGSVYRWAFVIPACLVVIAALAWPSRDVLGQRREVVQSQLGLPQVAVAAVLVVVLWRLSRVTPSSLNVHVSDDTTLAVVGFGSLFVGVGLLIRWLERSGRLRTWMVMTAAMLIAVPTLLEVAESSAWTRNQAAEFYGEVPVSFQVEAERRAERAEAMAAAWPRHRPVEMVWPPEEPWWVKHNSGSRYSYAGLSYYSSTVQAQTALPLLDLGYEEVSLGRHLGAPSDVVLAAVLSSGDPGSGTPPVQMVRVQQRHRPNPSLPSHLAQREVLAAAPGLYEEPVVEITSSSGRRLSATDSLEVGATADVTLSCRPGSTLFARDYDVARAATVVSGAPEVGFLAVEWPLGVVESGSVQLTLRPEVRLPGLEHLFGCVLAEVLSDAVSEHVVPEELTIEPGVVEARFAAPVSGTVVISTQAVQGWRCRVDGAEVAVEPVAGMLAVDAEGSSVSCSYVPPLLIPSTALGGAVFLFLLVVTLFRLRAGRGRQPRRRG